MDELEGRHMIMSDEIWDEGYIDSGVKGNTLPASVMTTSISEGATRQKERAERRATSLQVNSGIMEWLYPLCIYQQNSQYIKE